MSKQKDNANSSLSDGDSFEIPIGKYISSVRQNPWKLVSFILFVILVAMFLLNSSSKNGGGVSEDDAAKNLLSFISTSAQGASAELVSTNSVGPFYEINVKFNNQEIPAYVTQDGNFLVLNPVPISANAPKLNMPEIKEDPNKLYDVEIGDSPIKGNKNAKVKLIEFSDYECPYCEKFFKDTYKKIIDEYVDTGKVLFVFKDFPLSNIHQKAQKAAEAARCFREQQKDVGYFMMHDKLFNNQNDLSLENIKKLARQIGIFGSTFDKCLDEGKYEKSVGDDLLQGVKMGVTKTPTFFINGKKIEGALSFEEFKKIIDEELKG